MFRASKIVGHFITIKEDQHGFLLPFLMHHSINSIGASPRYDHDTEHIDIVIDIVIDIDI